MQVRMLRLAAGPFGVLPAGEIVEVTEAIGDALIAVNAAAAVDAPSPAVEQAIAPPVEVAAQRTSKRKK